MIVIGGGNSAIEWLNEHPDAESLCSQHGTLVVGSGITRLALGEWPMWWRWHGMYFGPPNWCQMPKAGHRYYLPSLMVVSQRFAEDPENADVMGPSVHVDRFQFCADAEPLARNSGCLATRWVAEEGAGSASIIGMDCDGRYDQYRHSWEHLASRPLALERIRELPGNKLGIFPEG